MNQSAESAASEYQKERLKKRPLQPFEDYYDIPKAFLAGYELAKSEDWQSIHDAGLFDPEAAIKDATVMISSSELTALKSRVEVLEAENDQLFAIKLDQAIDHPVYQASKELEGECARYSDALKTIRFVISKGLTTVMPGLALDKIDEIAEQALTAKGQS